MFSYAESALMADAVSHLDNQPHYSSTLALRNMGITLGPVFTDKGPAYRAAIWQRGSAKAFVIRGTFVSGTQIQNLVEDAGMKSLSRAPYEIVKAAVLDIGRNMSPPYGYNMFVGSSLGGSAAQVLGFLYGLPFMTFNAPGMRYDLMRRSSVRVISTVSDTLSAIETRGISELETIGSMLTPGRKIDDAYVKATSWLDQSYDQARIEIARDVGIPVPDSTANVTPEKQVGFNIAHSRDSIHNTTGLPIGQPYRFADWVEAHPANAVPPPHSPSAILYYHDMKKMADFVVSQSWGNQRPIKPFHGPLGKTYYFGPHTM